MERSIQMTVYVGSKEFYTFIDFFFMFSYKDKSGVFLLFNLSAFLLVHTVAY